MIVPNLGATTPVGVYPLTNVSPNAAGALLIQSRRVGGTSLTFCIRKRVTGSDVTNAAAPRTALTNFLTNAAVTEATDITATTAAQLHTVLADGCDVILEILTNVGGAVLQLELQAITGGT